MKEILIVAAEASSELYARRIIEEFKNRNLKYHFFGIGSQGMKEIGCEIIESSENMAVVGLWEVLAHFKVIASAFKRLVLRAKQSKPQIALLLDYPGFNLRLAKKLAKLRIPVVYYISPQVWAWRRSRVYDIKKIISKMLVVFPFEKAFYEKYQIPVSFVGHPLLDEINHKKLNHDSRRALRQQLGVSDDQFLIGLLPGSRHSELKYNLKTQVQACKKILAGHADSRFLLLVAPSLNLDEVRSYLPPDIEVAIRIVKDDPVKVLQLCDACIVASGTATVMTGLVQRPMVIMYKMHPLTGFIAKRLVNGISAFGMTNLILEEKAVPELFQEEASPENISKEILKFIKNPDYANQTRSKLSQIPVKLAKGDTAKNVVDNLLEYLDS